MHATAPATSDQAAAAPHAVRLLVVSTGSMADVVQALPVVADVRRAHPGARIDWLVEAPCAAIPRLHPGVDRVLPLAWRRWRGQWLKRSTWQAMGALRAELQRQPYDLVLDLQGLLTSALWARQAAGPVAGHDRSSARQPAAAWLYARTAAVPRQLHAVERNRRLAAAHLGYSLPPGPPQFGLVPPAAMPLAWKPRGAYALLIPHASRPEKLWPERHWTAVGRRLVERGLRPVVLWGRDSEQTLAERIAAGCDGDVPPFLKVGEMAAVLAGAQQVVGLDTGFSHLAAAYGRPTIGIYCDHEPGLTGITGPGPVASLGGKGQVPGKAEVLALLEQHLAAA